MKILLVGSGAREHAIARAVKDSKHPATLFCCGSNRNPGILSLAQDLHFAKAVPDIVAYAKQKAIDFAIIGPEAPLAAGVVDALSAIGISSIGPTQALAQVESSKGFTRDLLHTYQVDGQPRYRRFNSVNSDVSDFLSELGGAYVIKADGLCGGKGVKIAGEHLHSDQEALQFCHDVQGSFVIEEKLQGPEFSLISLSDGKHLVTMPAVQDHKRAFVGDKGPNTGGMGSYSCANHSLPFLDDHDIAAATAINQATVDTLYDKFKTPFIGFLYGGFMKTASGVKLIEYNARLGDPEAINVLALLNSDFIKICQAMLNGTLDQINIEFKPQASVVKYLVPNGYPSHPVQNQAIDCSKVDPDKLYFAAIDQQDQRLVMTGSRAVAVLGLGDDLAMAERQSEALAQKIKGAVFYRPDIGKMAATSNEEIKTGYIGAVTSR